MDAGLEAELEALQGQTDALLVRIAELRRNCPQQLQERLAASFQDRLCEPTDTLAESISDQLPVLTLKEEDEDRLVGELHRLHKLNEVE